MAQGTFESIALSIARLFEPLKEELNAGRVRTLFAELGLEFPPELETKTAFINALEKAGHEAGRLPELISSLVSAIEADDSSAISGAAIDLSISIKKLIENILKVSDELKNMGGLPGLPASQITDFAENLPKNLFDYLLVRNMEGMPGLVEFLEFIDAVDRTDVVSGDFTYTTRKFKIDQLFNFIGKPGTQLEALYDWGKPTFDGVALLDTLEKLLNRSGVPAIFDPAAVPPALDMIYLEAKPKTNIDPKGLEVTLLDKIIVESDEFGMDDWQVKLTMNANLGQGVRIVIQPNGNVEFFPPSGTIEGEATLEWIAGNKNGEPNVILGEAGGSRLEAKQISAKTGAGFAWKTTDNKATGVFSISGEVKEGKFVVDFSQGDGFLSQLLSGVNLESNFDIGFGYSSKEGLFFHGSGGLEIQLPTHIELGPIEISALTIGVGIADGKIPVDLGVSINASLGPLQAVVENMGLRANLSFPSGQDGNLGPLNIDLGFKPPNGVGLSLDAGVVKGGGYLFFDFDREEYAGALELVFSEWIALKAIGLITTKLPDGSKGFSLLVIITVEFGTGIQLGFGFTLLGVGGLLGLSRTAKIEALKDGVRTGAIESVMFPQDVIANAPRIISDLRNFFPPVKDIFLVGPMAKIGYGTPTLLSVSLGVILEFPSVNITILGVLKVALPDENADILRLQVNFIGRLEPSNQVMWFYAQLFDSRVLFITLEGGMGLLINWGSNANFVVSVGGFHPRYSPPPLPFPEPPRIAVSILNESYARVRIEGYFAVTSNAVMFGARAELFFGLSEFKIEGHLAFDALFQFNPFFFSFSMSFSLSVKVFGVGLFSVGFSGLLEGPTPWFIQGKGKISLLFFKISVPFEHSWGDSRNTQLEPIEVFPLLEKEFNALTNWEAVLPDSSNLLVSLRKLGESETGQLILHPVGKLRISQRKIPVDFKLDKVGAQRPADIHKATISASIGGDSLTISPTQEKFAIGQFKDLDDSNKLSTPAFEPLEGGIEVAIEGEQLRTSQAVKRVIRYETIIIDNNFKKHIRSFYLFLKAGYLGLNNFLFDLFKPGNAATQSVLSNRHKKQMQPFDEKIAIQPNGYSVAFNTDNKPFAKEAITFTSHAKAAEYMEEQVLKDPNLGGNLHVIPNTEINLVA